MALSDHRLERTSTMCALYVAQGIPWGFMATAVVSYLTQHGNNTTDAGKLTGRSVCRPGELRWRPAFEACRCPGPLT
jgi:hypothetical protein